MTAAVAEHPAAAPSDEPQAQSPLGAGHVIRFPDPVRDLFLTPPYYMIVTSLKSDAEVAHLATNPWIIANGVTFDQYRAAVPGGTDFLIYFKNTMIVTLCVVAITMVVSVLAAFSLSRMRFWGSEFWLPESFSLI